VPSCPSGAATRPRARASGSAPAARAVRWALLASFCLALSGTAVAEPWQEDLVLEPLTLPDQHGETRAIDPSVRAILFSRDMDGGGILKEAVGENGAALLERAGAVYVADVSRMPGLVRRLFALPSLRRRGYPVLLDEDGRATADFPSAEGKATLVLLDALRVARIGHFESAEALRTALLALTAEVDVGAAR
jgi:hypothetical protein